MIDDIRKLLDQYVAWLRDKTALRDVGDWTEITTPYLDRNNDYIQIYARRVNSVFVLSDDAYTIEDLEQSGCRLDSPKRQELLRMTLNGFGVQLENKALQIRATAENFAVRKHSLIQAMLAVNDMFYLAAPMVANLFFEDVVAWLDSNDVRFTQNVKFTGRSGYDHLFDFVIPKSRKQPERILQAITRPGRETAEVLAFSWIDTKEVRSPESKAYAILNDSDRSVSPTIVDALRSYDVTPVVWSARDVVRQELVD